MDKSNRDLRSSYTLIEILFVTTIIALLLAFTLAYYNSSNEGKEIESEAIKFVDVLELAKKKSSAADLAGYSCDEFGGYKIDITVANYSLSLCCDSACSSSTIIQTYTFPQNVSSQTTTSVIFKPLAGGINAASPVSVQLKNASITTRNCVTVTVQPSGVIEQEERTSC